MKSEHRHELQTNELEKLTEGIGKFFERYGTKIVLGIVAAIAVGVGIYYAIGMTGKTAESASDQISKAESPTDFSAIADNPDYSGLLLQTYARLAAAERQLAGANGLYITTKKGGLAELEEARDNFKAVLEAKSLPADAKERALRGLAYCLETMSKGDTKDAIAAYEEYLKEFPETKWKELIEDRIKSLKNPQAKELYAFLASDDRRPPDRKLPADFEALRKIRGHEKIDLGAERPIELPPIPRRLQTGLAGDAMPFPKGTAPGKTPPAKKSGPAFPEQPAKTPGTTSPDKPKPFKAPESKTEAKKTAPK